MEQLYRKVLSNERARPTDQVSVPDLGWIDTGDLPSDFVITQDMEIRRPVRLVSDVERLLDEGEIYSLLDVKVEGDSRDLIDEDLAGSINQQADFSQDLPQYVLRPLTHTVLVDDEGHEYTLDLPVQTSSDLDTLDLQ